MKKNYQWILFDADKTLFHFDDFAGLQLAFAPLGISFTKDDYHAYQSLNKPLWVQYQKGEITAEQVQHRRFDAWTNQLKISARELNHLFLEAMADTCAPLEGAIDLLNALQGKAKLGIITNGFTQLQQKRLERTGLHNHFDVVVISEEVGAAKPHPDIFDHALERMGNPDRQHVLMVGDTPESDILGGINAGLDTCWLNAHHALAPEGIVPTYEVSCLKALQELLLK